MSEEQVVLEEITPPAETTPETPAPNNPPEEPPAPEPAPETTKAKEPPAPPVPAVPPAAATVAPTPPVPIEKGVWAPQMQPAIALIEKLIAMGGEAGSMAQQIKAVLKQATSDTPPVAKAMSKAELGRLITGEVQKQLESALKAVPTLRKGLVSQEPEAADVRKTFESLSPEKKLRVALALQQQA